MSRYRLISGMAVSNILVNWDKPNDGFNVLGNVVGSDEVRVLSYHGRYSAIDLESLGLIFDPGE